MFLPLFLAFSYMSSLKPLASVRILTLNLVQAKPLPELKEPVAEEKNNAEVKRKIDKVVLHLYFLHDRPG